MIACAACGNVNPLGTSWCRKCGAKVVVRYGDIVQSITATHQEDAAQRWLRAGRSAIALALFAFCCSLVLRYAVVPAMPVADLPPLAMGDLLPTGAPGVTTTAATTAAAKPVEPSAPPVAALSGLLAWRRDQGPAVLNALGIDLGGLAALQRTATAGQAADGSFAGPDPLAATALAALALQAHPVDGSAAAAARARAWIAGQMKPSTGRAPLARSLALLALAEAGELTDAQLAEVGVFLIDGKAAVWQVQMQSLLPPAKRSTQLAPLRLALAASPWWAMVLDLNAGKQPIAPGEAPTEAQFTLDAKAFFTEAAATIARGEDRLAWAFLGWHLHPAPADLAETLRGWSQAPAAEVDADLVKAVGAQAAAAVAVLAITAPLRVLPLAMRSP